MYNFDLPHCSRLHIFMVLLGSEFPYYLPPSHCAYSMKNEVLSRMCRMVTSNSAFRGYSGFLDDSYERTGSRDMALKAPKSSEEIEDVVSQGGVLWWDHQACKRCWVKYNHSMLAALVCCRQVSQMGESSSVPWEKPLNSTVLWNAV